MKLTENFGVPRRKRGGDRITTSVTIDKTLYLHAKDHFNIPLTVEQALRLALESKGVDYQRPHDSQVWSPADPNDPKGKPVTWGEARRQGLVDNRDRAAEGGVADAEGAAL